MALTPDQQAQYDAFVANNPGDESRAASALGFDTSGASPSSSGSNTDISQASNPRDAMIGRDSGSWEAYLKQQLGPLYDPTTLQSAVANVSYAQNAGMDPKTILDGIVAKEQLRATNSPNSTYTADGKWGGGSLTAPVTTPTTASWFTTGAGGASGTGGTGFGAAPAAFGETYSALGRPSWLQGPYTPGTFTPPTQTDLENSPGYLASQDAMQRGLERSAASKGTVLSGGFVGRTLPRALGESAAASYANLYQQRYGAFNDAQARDASARATNESAFQNDTGNNLNQYLTRFNTYQQGITNTRNAETDLWNRNMDLAHNALTAAGLARPTGA